MMTASMTFSSLGQALLRHRLAAPDGAAAAIDGMGAIADLLTLDQGLLSGQPVSQTVIKVMRALAWACEAETGRLFCAAPGGQGFLCFDNRGAIVASLCVPMLAGLTGAALDADHPTIWADAASQRQYDRTFDDVGAALALVPLYRADEPIGVVQLGGPRFAAEIADLLQHAAPTISEALAIATPQLAVTVEEIGSGDAGASQLDQISGVVLATALDMLEADRAAVFLHDRTTDQLVSRTNLGYGPVEVRQSARAGLEGAVFRDGVAMAVPDVYQDPRFNPLLDRRTQYRTRSLLVVPVEGSSGHRHGVVTFANSAKGSFSEADERRARALVSQIGLAIDHAQTRDEVLGIKDYTERVLASLTNGVLTIDVAGQLTFHNSAAERILRRSLDGLRGQPVGEVFTDYNAWMLEAIDAVADDPAGQQVVTNDLYIESDDSWVAVNITIAAMKDRSDTLVGFMLVLEDVSREQELRRTMSRYMSNEVVDRLISDSSIQLGGQSQTVTVLFSDIRGFTALTERLGAAETVTMLNTYFSFMEDVIANRSGVVDKYIGDAIMALFGAPIPSDRDPDNAVQAAMDMLTALTMLNQRRQAEGMMPIKIGMGIATGAVITGNIGSAKRMDYTVIGDPVNLASRMESLTKLYGAQVVIDGDTEERLTLDVPRRVLDLVRVRGQSKVVRFVEVLIGSGADRVAGMEFYREGFDHYVAGRFSAALPAFTAALQACPTDRAAGVMIDRCQKLIANPPEDWDGVTRFGDR
ncbi:MAG: adenylate/guanylate cyclase domain-containing protein [Alphaproteobacteria bacterium]|nr:adenylate/guanylate cyclase domain-containing protein [Alphaproteobacteria bacterium]